MVAKKSAKKPAKREAVTSSALRFNPDWIRDPVPRFRNFDKSILREIAQAKKDFGIRINEIIRKGQR